MLLYFPRGAKIWWELGDLRNLAVKVWFVLRWPCFFSLCRCGGMQCYYMALPVNVSFSLLISVFNISQFFLQKCETMQQGTLSLFNWAAIDAYWHHNLSKELWTFVEVCTMTDKRYKFNMGVRKGSFLFIYSSMSFIIGFEPRRLHVLIQTPVTC